jgi:hypothetical protein
MDKAIIKLAFKQIIDSGTTGDFEGKALDSSYNEFLIAMRPFKATAKNWTEFKTYASTQHINNVKTQAYKGVEGNLYIIKNLIPQVEETFNGHRLNFSNILFDIVEGDFINKNSFKICIIYITDFLTLLDSLNEDLILSFGDKTKEIKAGEIIQDIFTFELAKNISIVSYKTII